MKKLSVGLAGVMLAVSLMIINASLLFMKYEINGGSTHEEN